MSRQSGRTGGVYRYTMSKQSGRTGGVYRYTISKQSGRTGGVYRYTMSKQSGRTATSVLLHYEQAGSCNRRGKACDARKDRGKSRMLAAVIHHIVDA